MLSKYIIVLMILLQINQDKLHILYKNKMVKSVVPKYKTIIKLYILK